MQVLDRGGDEMRGAWGSIRQTPANSDSEQFRKPAQRRGESRQDGRGGAALGL